MREVGIQLDARGAGVRVGLWWEDEQGAEAEGVDEGDVYDHLQRKESCRIRRQGRLWKRWPATYLVVHAALAKHLHIVPFIPRLDDPACRLGILDIQSRHAMQHKALPSVKKQY